MWLATFGDEVRPFGLLVRRGKNYMAIVWMGAKITWIVDGCKNYTGENSGLKIYDFFEWIWISVEKVHKIAVWTNLIIVLSVQN